MKNEGRGTSAAIGRGTMKIRRAEDERVRGAESGIPGLVQLFTFGFYAESPFENLYIRYTKYEILSVGRASSAHV
jgi:hypothetical protein